MGIESIEHFFHISLRVAEIILGVIVLSVVIYIFHRCCCEKDKEGKDQDEGSDDSEISHPQHLKSDFGEDADLSINGELGRQGKPCQSCFTFLQLIPLPKILKKPLGIDDDPGRSFHTPLPTSTPEDTMLTTGTDNNGCGAKLTKGQGLSPTDPIQQHYKKTGLLGGITGAFGDKKTM